MQQPLPTTYTDIAEVRTVTGAAARNRLLAEGWVLLGIYPLSTVGEMTQGDLVEASSRDRPKIHNGMCGG